MSDMARKRFDQMNCAAAQALELIGDWWTLLIVRETFYGVSTFSGFESKLGIAKNILAERLKRLVDNEIMYRDQPKPGVARYTYHLTEKGDELLLILISLMQWGDKWVFGEGKEPLIVRDAQNKKPIQKIALLDSGGLELRVEDIQFRPGPGANEQTLERFAEARRKRN